MIVIKKHYNIFFTLIFTFWYSTEIIFNTTLDTIFGMQVSTISSVVNMLVFSLLMIQIIAFQSYRRKELIIIAVITIPIVVATILADHKSMLSAWMFIVSAKNVKMKDIIKTAYTILKIMVPLVILLCFLGIIDDRIMFRDGMRRFSLGFSHPNQLGLRIFQLMVCHCYLVKDRFRIRDYIYILLATVVTILVPNSQTAYICLIVLFLFVLVFEWLKKHNSTAVYMKGLMVGVVLFNVLSVFLTLIDIKKYSFLAQIDKWMSIRFSAGHRVWLLYGISLLGQKVYVTEEERSLVGITWILYLDNAYINILLRYGIILYLVFTIGFFYLIKYQSEKKNYILVIILFVYSLYGVMEAGFYMMTHNIFLLAFAEILYSKSSISENKQKHIRSDGWADRKGLIGMR